MIRPILLFALIACFSPSYSQTNYCIPNRFSETPYFDTSEIKKELNVLYGNAFNKGKSVSEDLKLDIYYPDTTVDPLERRPMILHIHGGSFLEGDKSGGATVCKEWARRGFVAATINYRMGWACANTVAALLCLCNDAAGIRTAIYEAIQDSRAAMRYLQAHADEYGIDPDYIFVAGESAGSISGLMTVYTQQEEADVYDNAISHQQLGALDSSGNNLPGGYRIRGIINDCGAVQDTSVIDADEILPTISFHDEKDCLVPMMSAYALNCTGSCYNYVTATGSGLIHQRALSLGACSKLYEVKGSASHCSFPINPLIQKSSCFLRGILCNDCQSGYSTNANDTVPCKQDIATSVDETTLTGNLTSLRVYPNPVKDETASLIFELSQAQRVAISVVDVLGREVLTTSRYFEKGRNTFQIDTKHLATGINYCFLRTDAGLRSTILVRQ